MRKRDWINLSILVVVLIAAYLVHSSRQYEHKRSWLQLDTYIEVTAISQDKNWEAVLDSLSLLIDELENEFSYHQQNSKLYTINHSSDSVFTISSEMKNLLDLGAELYQKTGKRFDLSIGALTDIWDIDSEIIPDEREILAAQARTGYDKLVYTDSILIKSTSLKLNLGAIAKGFIIDRMTDYLLQKGALSGIINVGGDIVLLGQEKPLRIGIQHPRKKRNEIIDVVNLQNGAVVTSGDYERYFVRDSIRYHHIIDPLTGYPASNCLSVTVIADNALTADAYSTALFLLQPEAAIELAEQVQSLEAMVYFEVDGIIENISTKGFAEFLQNQ